MSLPRGVKRARLSEDSRRDTDVPSAESDLHLGDVKGEYGSPGSDVTGFSRNTPGSVVGAPDQTFAVPTLPQPSQVEYASPSLQTSSSTYIPVQPVVSHQTSPSLGLSSNNDQRQTSSQNSPSTKASSTTSRNPSNSAFRNVSACNRCRLRKNRCDQRLPTCRACEKAGVKCVGYDPFMGREVPRSYVYYLESRTAYLQDLLRENSIEFASAESFALEKQPDDERPIKEVAGHVQSGARAGPGADGLQQAGHLQRQVQNDQHKAEAEEKKLDKLVSNIGMVSVQGASDPRFLGSTSGISFARVVFAAVKSTASRATSEKGGVRPAKVAVGSAIAAGGESMRDSVFGLHTKPTFKGALFPDKDLGLKLVNLYFEYANPQLPILHRGEFMVLFERVYDSQGHQRTPRESYLLNIVFAIGAGTILDSSGTDGETASGGSNASAKGVRPPSKKARLSSQQHQPEEYHSSAIVHLENFLGSSSAGDQAESSGGGLEELQAVLLLAGFALLRPVAPGLWYIVGVAMRLAVDLGLHHEDVGDSNHGDTNTRPMNNIGGPKYEGGAGETDKRESGRRQWIRDLRRRLWWSVYSLDRLVSSCVGRPFGITDQVVTTDFPSLLDDRYITTSGFLEAPGQSSPSAKVVSRHYFRFRLVQSEILQVLQYQYAQRVHAAKNTAPNEYMYTKLSSPFLGSFSSFQRWRTDVDRRLWEWKESAPSQQDAGVQFSPLFFELNYWQAVILLYRQGLTTPSALAHEVSSLDDGMISPEHRHVEEQGDEEFVYLKIAEAGQRVLKLYRQLHRVHLVNYTFLATHHLFMAGISFLYAIWHSTTVRSHLSLDDVDFTVLAATSVLTDLIDKCPPAEACKDAFDRMSKATISMCMSTTGFGPQALQHEKKDPKSARSRPAPTTKPDPVSRIRSRQSVQTDTGAGTASFVRQQEKLSPRFDMDLRDLFSEDETKSQMLNRPSNSAPGYWVSQSGQQQQIYQAEAPGFRTANNAFTQRGRQDMGDGTENRNIDPLLQQASPQTQISQLSGQEAPPQGFEYFPQQMQDAAFPMTPEFDSWFLDSFAPGGEQLPYSDPNVDLFGVGGMDGGVDLFNGFFFGNGNAAQSLHSSGFAPS